MNRDMFVKMIHALNDNYHRNITLPRALIFPSRAAVRGNGHASILELIQHQEPQLYYSSLLLN